MKANYKVKAGDSFRVKVLPPVTLEARSQDIPLDILYEDEDVIVVNKPRGMVVHPAAGESDRTLVNALLYHCHDLSSINGVIRPGIVHRLDKDTSGVMICAKNDQAHLSLAEQIQKKEAKRTYLAIVRGNLKRTMAISRSSWTGIPETGRRWQWSPAEDAGRPRIIGAGALWQIYGGALQVAHRPDHQIRVHMTYLGHPLVGIPNTPPANLFSINGQALHSWTLTFRHPRTGGAADFYGSPFRTICKPS